MRVFLVLLLAGASSVQAQEGSHDGLPSLRLNSFLVEEAFTQEEGIVEHINTFHFSRRGVWEYSFTQEWPLFGSRHQISFSLPLQRDATTFGNGTGIGDVEVSYAYQLLGIDRSAIFLAPRLSITIPTGAEEHNRGAGAPGIEFALPGSMSLTRKVIANWNLGAGYTPAARNARGDEASVASHNMGGSLVWLKGRSLGLVFEAAWESAENVDGPGETSRDNSFLVAPGIRGAISVLGLGMVPGLVIPIGVGPSSGERTLLLFLSVEHPF